MKEENIIYSTGLSIGDCYVIRSKYGYEVYKNGVTHATIVAQIGYKGEVGIKKAMGYANTLKTPNKV